MHLLRHPYHLPVPIGPLHPYVNPSFLSFSPSHRVPPRTCFPSFYSGLSGSVCLRLPTPISEGSYNFGHVLVPSRIRSFTRPTESEIFPTRLMYTPCFFRHSFYPPPSSQTSTILSDLFSTSTELVSTTVTFFICLSLYQISIRLP